MSKMRAKWLVTFAAYSMLKLCHSWPHALEQPVSEGSFCVMFAKGFVHGACC